MSIFRDGVAAGRARYGTKKNSSGTWTVDFDAKCGCGHVAADHDFEDGKKKAPCLAGKTGEACDCKHFSGSGARMNSRMCKECETVAASGKRHVGKFSRDGSVHYMANKPKDDYVLALCGMGGQLGVSAELENARHFDGKKLAEPRPCPGCKKDVVLVDTTTGLCKTCFDADQEKYK